MSEIMNKLTEEDAFQFIESMYTMAILDKEGRYIYINPGWSTNSKRAKDYLGLERSNRIDPGDIIGKYVWDVVPETKAKYVLETGEALIGQHIATSDTFTTYIPRFDKEGNINGCYLYTILGSFAEAAQLNQQLTALTEEKDYYMKALAFERRQKYSLDRIIGKSAVIEKLKEQILSAARVPSSVLIEGEHGTGKELIAKTIHQLGLRADEALIRFNCASSTPDTIDIDLFGYKAGAVPGSGRKDREGRLELANGGTLFIDEVNLLPLATQTKLINAINSRQILPPGYTKPIKLDVRFIASSNESLSKMVEEGRFREDLYYALNVVNIVTPPLRTHKEDIPLMTNSLIDVLNQKFGMNVQGTDSRVMQMLTDYDWPGNVSEFVNAIERAMSTTKASLLIPSDFEALGVRIKRSSGLSFSISQAYGESGGEGKGLRGAKQVTERNVILDALTNNKGNRSKTARDLGISRTELYRKLEKYNIK